MDIRPTATAVLCALILTACPLEEKGGGAVEGAGCEDLFTLRPMEVQRTATVEGTVRALCLLADQELHVYSEADGAWTLTRFDPETLEVSGEDPVGPEQADTCSADPDPLRGNGGGLGWWVDWEERDEDFPSWYEAKLTVMEQATGNTAVFSFNQVHNLDAPVDTGSWFPEDSALEVRILDDGSARFYLHTHHGFRIDAVFFNHLSATLAQDDPVADLRHTYPLPSMEHSGGSYGGDTMIRVDDPTEPAKDLLIVNPARSASIEAVSVAVDAGTVQFSGQGPVLQDLQWGSNGWRLGGVDAAGTLWAQARVGIHDAGRVVGIDPPGLQVVADDEIACLRAPELSGFGAVPWDTGRLVWFGNGGLVAVVDDGEITGALGDVHGTGSNLTDFARVIGSEAHPYLYVASEGVLKQIALP